MTFKTIGVMSPGDMGQAVAQQLKLQGFRVCTALDKRSARSRALALEAGLVDVGSIAALTEQCELIISVMNPGAALEFAGEVAQALAATRRSLLFVDCNATAPATMHKINATITEAGGRCADAGIIGPPPRGTAKTMLFVSGPEAESLAQLATPLISVRVMSERIGDASAIKMCYGAMTKGVTALVLELLIAARRLGVEDALETEFRRTRGEIYDWVMGQLPRMPPKAYRWSPEMLEIAQTFEATGMTRRMFEGAADMYEYVAASALGRETPESSRELARGGKDVVRLLADERRD